MKIRWIQVCFLLTALPQFTEAWRINALTVNYGENVTLPCENSRKPQNNCGYTRWKFYSAGKGAVELIELGNISESVVAKKNRLRLTEDCSLVINNVQEGDAGYYYCDQHILKDVYNPESYFNLIVSAGEKTPITTPAKRSTKPSTKMKTTTAKPTTAETTPSSTTTRYSTASQSGTTATAKRTESNGQKWLWLYILVAAVAFILTVVVVVKVIRQKGNKTQTGDSPDDPEEGVSYATISYTKNQRKAKGDGQAEDDHVTYSTVKTSSSAAAVGASTDPSSLYSTVNKEKK